MQSVSRTTRSKRVTASIATGCAVALAGGALSAGPVNAQMPADSPQARKVTVSERNVPYRCKATNSVVNQAIGGPQRFLVDGKASFKGSFKRGTKIKPRGIKLTLIITKRLARKIRKDLGTKRVRGGAKVKFDVRAKPGKTRKMPVKGLRSGWKKVPRNKKLRIPTNGKAKAYKIGKKTKKLNLLAPRRFRINARLAPPAVGIVKKTGLRCKFVGKPKKRNLGKLPVR